MRRDITVGSGKQTLEFIYRNTILKPSGQSGLGSMKETRHSQGNGHDQASTPGDTVTSRRQQKWVDIIISDKGLAASGMLPCDSVARPFFFFSLFLPLYCLRTSEYLGFGTYSTYICWLPQLICLEKSTYLSVPSTDKDPAMTREYCT